MIFAKKIMSLVMALVILVSLATGLDFSAFATTDVTQTETEPTQYETVEETQTETQAQPTVETQEGTSDLPTTEETVAPTVNEEKVGKVGKLYKDTAYCDEIQFYWNEVEKAQGYRIYYKNNDEDDDYRLLTTTSGTKLTIKELPHTTPFQFKVTAFIVEDGEIIEGQPSIGKTATQPAATKKPSLKKSSSSIKISWNKNSRADGYRIYRMDSSTDGKLVLYKTIKKNSTTTFEDKKVKKGKSYYYQVRAYREMYEDKVYLGTGSTLRTIAGLCAPSLESCTSQLKRVTINWNKNKYASGYEIYYKADDRTEYKLLKTTKSTYLNTHHLRAGHTYNFRIKPYKLVGSKKTKVYGTYLSVTKKATSAAYGKKIGKTYIEINIPLQHMWYYVDGKLYAETDVVTGNYYGYSTPKGAYSIYQKASPATLSGPTWCVNVSYWMAFTYSGCGIHDSDWRDASEYGGKTYKGNGSHGCVNTPKSVVKKMYKKAKIGTPVVVY